MSDVMLTAFRHDAHKFTGESHEDAREEFAGVPVNQSVPEGADGDAATLSRPQQKQEQTVPTHDDHYRLSLLTGETAYDPGEFSRATIESEVADLVTIEDAQTAHERWLASDVAAAFNESVYRPLHLAEVPHAARGGAAGQLPHRERVPRSPAHRGRCGRGRPVPHGLRRRPLRAPDRHEGGDRPSARLGSRPWRSWASAWNRLTAHPLDTDHDKYDMALDANLRRTQAWSTALQYIEDYAEWRPDQ